MAEDKRVAKTKRNLKETMIELLQEMPFEKITVTELFRRGETSRITFYTYYEDKYALVNEMFSDYIQEADRNYHDLQARNNPGGDGFIGYENLLECILQLFYNNIRFFSHSTPEENPYLFSVFFNHIFLSVDDYLQRHTGLAARYSTKEVAALLCNGFWGVISICHSEKMSREAVCERVKAMYNDILLSDLFRRK